MSNNSVSGPVAAGGTVCQIGKRVLLAHELDGGDIESRLEAWLVRRFDFRAGETLISAILLNEVFESAMLGADWRATSGLDQFAAAIGISGAGRASLIATVYATVAPMFRLLEDEGFRSLTAQLLAAPGLAKGHAHLDLVSGIDTAIAAVPSKARLADGDVVVSQGDTLSIGRVKSVEKVLARDARSERLAALDFTLPPVEGPALVVTARGVASLHLAITEHDDLEALHKAYSASRPDRINLLQCADRDASVELGVIGRRKTISTSLSESMLALRFEMTSIASMPHGLFVAGWFHDPDGLIETITAIDYSLADPSVSDHWMLYSAQVGPKGERVQAKRFAAFLPRQECERPPVSIRFRVCLTNGENYFIDAPRSQQDLLSQRKTVLDAIAIYAFDLDILRRIYLPALAPLQEKINGRQFVDRTVEYGPRSSRAISIVVPLYKQIGFLRSQLSAFNVDPFIRKHCQIVYALDDPLIGLRVEEILGGSEYVHQLDIKLVVLGRNGGYALANNFGVGAADGETIVLMNSDVIPESTGWLEACAERLNRLPASSVIGPKLIYADESLQHAGMYFHRLDTRHWQNMHYFKGYGRALPPAEVEREVPAVTGALMVLRKADFLAVGGFTSDYVIGDYEDSDLCLKLRAMGGTCLYMPSVTLFHFERQSMQGSDQDLGSTIYNRALHTERWNDAIEALMAGFGGVNDAI